MQQSTMTSLDEAIQLVDAARHQMEVEIAALGRLLHDGDIQIADYTKRQAELREEKIEPITAAIADALSQTYTGSKLKQARYLKAAYDHLATGRATIEAFAWKDAQRKARFHREDAYRQERDREHKAIQREAQALTIDQLFPISTQS